jgi:predicted HicB family RNase H-like nuclease
LGSAVVLTFMAPTPANCARSSKKSLAVFLEVCKEQGIEPRRRFSGRFNLRVPPELHERLSVAAESQGKSLDALAQARARKQHL